MLKDLFDGFGSYGRAFTVIRKERLWRFFLIPALISLILAIIIFGTAWYTSDDLGAWLTGWYPWERGKGWIQAISTGLGGILVIALGLILYKNLVLALASPFMSLLSERIEKRYTSARPEPKWTISRLIKESARGLRLALRNIIREIFWTVAVLILALFPIFSPFSAVAIFGIQSYYAGFGSMDFTLERYFSVSESVSFVRRHRGLAIGNGAVFILLLMTGIGFIVALPWSTVAATLEVLDRIKDVDLREKEDDFL